MIGTHRPVRIVQLIRMCFEETFDSGSRIRTHNVAIAGIAVSHLKLTCNLYIVVEFEKDKQLVNTNKQRHMVA